MNAEQLISINKKCTCALKITYRTLLEIGLKPAISSIAEIIVGTTLSHNHFGLYTISVVPVKGCVDFIDNVYCADCLQQHLEEKLAKFFQNHRRKHVMFFINKETEHAWKQFLAKGNYKQLTGSTYKIGMGIGANKASFSYGLLNDHQSAFRDIPGTYNWSVLGRYIFESEYTILNKGKELPNAGFKRIFLLPRCQYVCMSKCSC